MLDHRVEWVGNRLSRFLRLDLVKCLVNSVRYLLRLPGMCWESPSDVSPPSVLMQVRVNRLYTLGATSNLVSMRVSDALCLVI